VQGIVRTKPYSSGSGERAAVRVSKVSNALVHRELQVLKRIFSLAMKSRRIANRLHIPMLRESAPRAGFVEAEQLAAVLRRLSAYVRPVIEFASLTGWDASTTKNGDGLVFPMTQALRTLLMAQLAEHERLKNGGHINCTDRGPPRGHRRSRRRGEALAGRQLLRRVEEGVARPAVLFAFRTT
jgi:hypothetical protein